jgi:hypothetical protein
MGNENNIYVGADIRVARSSSGERGYGIRLTQVSCLGERGYGVRIAWVESG